MRERALTEEEYRTIFSEVNASVNSRPLWPSNDGDINQPPITCNDILRPGGLERDPVTLNTVYCPRKRYEYIQNVVNEWWKLWLEHFVPNLQERSKWYKKRDNLSTGDIVLLRDSNIPRGKWKMAVVTKIYPGNDGRVRSAEIKMKDKKYVRPITKLTLLLSKDGMKNYNKSEEELSTGGRGD